MNGYLLQAIAIPLWWVAMATSDRVYGYFAFPGIERKSLFAFALPDVVVIAALSFLVWMRPNRTLQACVLGAFIYGTLWCVSASIMTSGGYISTVVMLLGALFNIFLLLGPDAFRMSRVRDRRVHLRLTVIQSIIIWTTTLLLIPLGIVHAAGKWPPHFEPISATVAALAFLCFSALGIWSGLVMASAGEGTPLPLVGPRRLVVTGPYAYVRNPMAVAGLGQGFSVALALRSPEVAAYVVVGMLIWNYFVRPEEEKYLQSVFGVDFEHYRSQVRCWIPRGRAFLPRASRS